MAQGLASPPRLSALALDRLEDLRIQVAGLEALGELAAVLDPAGHASRWATAGRLAELLARFETTSWPRNLRGGRMPRNQAEAAMVRILEANLPRSQRRIIDLID